MPKIDNFMYSDISGVKENPILHTINSRVASPFFRFKYCINHILPRKMKFMQDIHLAIFEDEIKTYTELFFVKNTSKIIFSNFMTMDNSSELLLAFFDCIFNKYSSLKEAVFYITLFDNDAEVINLLLNGAKFKKIASLNYYDVKKHLHDYCPPNYFKRYIPNYAEQIADFANSLLKQEQKFYFTMRVLCEKTDIVEFLFI